MYAEILALITRAIAKNHGFIFPDNIDVLRHESARTHLYTSDAEIVLEIIDQYLTDNKVNFEALKVKDGYTMPTIEPNRLKSGKIDLDWSLVSKLVEEMYKVWEVKRADRSIFEQYELDPVNAILVNYKHSELIEIFDRLYAVAVNPYYAPRMDKNKLAKGVFEMLNPSKGWLKIKLYLDAEYKCIGGEACDHWATYHQTSDRKIHYEREITIKAGYNPLNRVLLDILQENTDEALKLDATPPAPAPEPKPDAAPKSKTIIPKTQPAQHGQKYADAKLAPELPKDFFLFCTKAEKNLYYTSFAGLEKAFKEFLVVKQELAAINITVGKMTASQSTAKSWNINGGETGKGKTALFWDANGWEIGPRTVNGTLPEGIEGWVLMEYLADNNAEANNLHAAHWYDQTDEDAETEALALQQKEVAAAKKSKNSLR